MKLIENFGSDVLNIVSPTEGKKVLFGKGKCKKGWYDTFIDNRLEDEVLWWMLSGNIVKINGVDFKQPKP